MGQNSAKRAGSSVMRDLSSDRPKPKSTSPSVPVEPSPMSFKVAVVGATGNVGREILSILAERQFPASTVDAVASERSAGAEVSFGDDAVLKVHALDTYDFRGVDIALFSPGGKISADHA